MERVKNPYYFNSIFKVLLSNKFTGIRYLETSAKATEKNFTH